MLKKFIFTILLLGLINSCANALFTLALLSGAPVNIGAVKIGGNNFSSPAIELLCTVQGNPWELQVYATNDLIDSSTGYTLGIQNLKWYGAYAGNADPPNQNITATAFVKGLNGESIPLSLDPDTALVHDGSFTRVDVKVGLGVVIPETQPQGNYTTTVRFTMTE